MRAYMHVFARICVRICTYMQVCANIRTSMRLTTFLTKNTCIYVQYVQIRANTAQHTYNIRAYTYFIFVQIRAYKSHSICKYMHVYASICMYAARMTYMYVCELYLYTRHCKYVQVCACMQLFFKSHSICTYIHVNISICMYIARLLYVYVCELYV